MKRKFKNVCFIVLLLLAVACSSESERRISGKWNLAGRMMGGAPSSFWFKWNGVVVAPWEKHNFALLSEGTYEFTDKSHIKIRMDQGYYKGNVYFFEVIKLTEDELILGSNYEEFRLKRCKEKDE